MTTFKFSNKNRSKVNKVSSSTKSQRSTCVAKIFRYKNPNINSTVTARFGDVQNINPLAATLSFKDSLQDLEPLVIDNDIISCSIAKKKGQMSGSFSLTLKKGKQERGEILPTKTIDYIKTLHPGDWIMIYMKKSGKVNTNSIDKNSGLKFLGIIEDISFTEVDEPGTGKPKLEYTITGKDFGKVFDMSLYFNPVIATQGLGAILGAEFNNSSEKVLKQAQSKGARNATSPDIMMKALISFFYGGNFTQFNQTNQAWYIPSKLAAQFKPASKIKSNTSFIDILDQTKIGLHNYDSNQRLTLPNTSLLGKGFFVSIPSSGNVWALMQHISNSLLNEVFVELTLVTDSKTGKANLVPSLVFRQMPFSNKKNQEVGIKNLKNDVQDFEKTYFTNLPRKTIDSNDIKLKDIGSSDSERINQVVVVPKIINATIQAAYTSLVNVPSVQRYGLKTIQAETPYAQGEDTPEKYTSKCCALLADWFFQSHALYSGSIVIDGSDDFIGIGNNLFISDVQQLFHIEGYQHQYNIDPSGTIMYNTIVQVSRGQIFNGKASFMGSGSDVTTIVANTLENIR